MKLVIVGGGFGGIKTALEFSGYKDVEVKLISNNSNFEYNAALYRSATGHSPMEVVLPLTKIFEDDPNIEVILDEVVDIDIHKKVIMSQTGNSYRYDNAVLALGQVINYFGIEGMGDNSYSLDSVRNTIKLRERLKEVVLARSVDNPHFIVIGAGPSGVELAAELNSFAREISNKYQVMQKRFRVTLIEGADRVLPGFDPKSSAKAKKRLEALGVEVRLECKVTKATKNAVMADGNTISANTVIWTAGFKNNAFYEDHKSVFELSKGGRVVVDKRLMAADNVYVIGDNAQTPYTGMAQTALYDAVFVAADIKKQIVKEKRLNYKPKAPMYVVPVGGKYAVFTSEMIKLHGYVAWLLRRVADLRLFAYFEPFKDAIKTWRKGNKRATDY